MKSPRSGFPGPGAFFVKEGTTVQRLILLRCSRGIAGSRYRAGESGRSGIELMCPFKSLFGGKDGDHFVDDGSCRNGALDDLGTVRSGG